MAPSLRRCPAWYLWVLATDPDHRGRGHATSLIRRVLGRCDADGLAAFLETTDPANPRFYARFGFQELLRIDGGPALPTVWLLSRSPDREPKRSGGALRSRRDRPSRSSRSSDEI
jgi:N-acetylglutamate synthase-like GNAT family acetyltransferase